MAESCPICERRRAIRPCPGLETSRWRGSNASRICAQCCGEQREVGIDCPPTCTYLVAAHRYEAQRRTPPADPAFRAVRVGEDFLYQHQVLVTAVSLLVVRAERQQGSVYDREVVEAVEALAQGYKTLDAGLYYEQPPVSVAARQVYEHLKTELERVSAEQQQSTGTSLRPGDVLKALVFLLRVAQIEGNGRPKSRKFLGFLRGKLPSEAVGEAAARPRGGSLIVPGR